jgi:carboxymethylenebutenolidase
MMHFGTRRHGGTGYMAYSERSGPGVLVLHEFFGLQPSFVSYADSLEAEGFTVLVPDLYDGRLASNIEEASALRDGLDFDATMQRLDAACEHLIDNWHPRLGVIGFSFGASLATALVQQRPAEATIVYYGFDEVDPTRWSGPILGHFATDDDWTPLQEATDLFANLSAAGIDARMFSYEETGHWFANESVPDAFNNEAAGLAFERSVDFLRHHLS